MENERITATVEAISKEKEGDFGPYRSVLFRLESGEEFWKSYAIVSKELTYLVKGFPVCLEMDGEKNGKPHYKIATSAPGVIKPAPKTSAPPRTQTSPQNYGNSHRPESVTLVQRADDLARFYRYCHDLAMREMCGEVPADGAIPIALAIFQQALSH
jgi:hypothetical protein